MTIIQYQFDPPTVDLIIRGLGKLPHEEVAGTINRIIAHAQATLNPPKPKRKAKAKPVAPAPTPVEPAPPPAPKKKRKA